MRQVLGIEGRAGHERKNVFEYKASEIEPPVQVMRVDGESLTPILYDVVRQNPDGTLVLTQGRILVVATDMGEHKLRFPKGWGEQQLRAAAEARGLLGGRPVAAHVPAPETIEEFKATSKSVIRAVFGPFQIEVFKTDLDDPAAPIVPTLLRFNLSSQFLRGVAKIAFHYFLWACPSIGGDEPEFEDLKKFIRDGTNDASDFINKLESLVDRIPADDGVGNNAHVFASASLADDLIVQVHLFSMRVGPSFPTFVVRLGRRPDAVPASWRTTHVAAYEEGVAGHDGTLYALPADQPPLEVADGASGTRNT